MRGRIAVLSGVVVALMVASVVIAGPAGASTVAARDNTSEVCAASSKTISNGLKVFVSDMKKVSSKATGGDLSGAQQLVRQGGDELSGVGVQLRKDAADADSHALHTAVTDLAAEFETLGGSLKDLTSLQGFDTTKLQGLANKLAKICGVPPGSLAPSPTG